MPSQEQSFEPKYSLDGNDKKFDFGLLLEKNKYSVAGVLIGVILVGLGLFIFKQGYFESQDKIEVLSSTSISPESKKQIVVDVSGAVEKPGVYKLNNESRVEDLLIAAGGISADADRGWVEKYINKAAKLTDGQKLYIYKTGEQSNSLSANNDGGSKLGQEVLGTTEGGLVNINTASLQELDSLPGIGQVYGQSIIEHRPYSSVEELLTKSALKNNVYEKIKELVTVY